MRPFIFNTTLTLLLAATGMNATSLEADSKTPSMGSLAPIKDPNALIGNELSRLDTLIQATRQSLAGQLQLRESIADYKKIQDAYMVHVNDNEILFRMIKSAYRTLKLIQENHLEHTFDPEFISELKVLAQVATKRGVPKP